ncbi:MAG: L-histidine N(alpha)-methyltransferase, partial [Planctomycetes bacterium]|nr:L-histidine N(alpha)-methyltransferase [Planctomycetota bacterium]
RLRKEPVAYPRLVLWLGSNIGNFERTEAASFLRQVGTTLTTDDRLLIGIDLRKDRSVLEPAYNDARGVTAQFNLNLLARINRDLGGHFNLRTFRHRAVYNEEEGRMEIFLVSTVAQQVAIDQLKRKIPFAAGESIHTENSYKYSLAEIQHLATEAGFQLQQQWLDRERRFSVNLLGK